MSEVNADGLIKLLQIESSAQTKLLLVNFWATWCVPCREEFPDLVKINDEFAPRGLNFITVSLDDPGEITKAVPQFLREMRATKMSAYLLNTPEPETAINAVDPQWSGGLPATFLFDRERRVIFKHIGRINPAELRAAIEGAMNK
ncbi:MAG: TlpA family protein disulfide reductase [Pyrinomonadaceae bacterium]|nr:TlpA family protein disulfide reductase [Pyrinomonadaceae bacterium]